MSFRSYTLLVLTLVVSACASSSGGGQTAAGSARRGANLIVRAELAGYQGQNALVAVEDLRRRWVQPRRSGTFDSSGSFYPGIVVNGVPRGELRELSVMSSDEIETMRYISPSDATTRYGTGYMGGAIEVTTITAR